ncbi:MAG TPA: hypothetical protein VFQ58_02695 [Flavisolibacter sp.]|nr:hypothetical protein [Flavisolibacter sp.]
MNHDYNNPQPEDNNQPEQHESDTQRIIHRHLQDKDDIITDEDIRNVRVGMTPPISDVPTLARFEEHESNNGTRIENGEQITPWDTVEDES